MPIKKATFLLIAILMADYFYIDFIHYINTTFNLVDLENRLLLTKVIEAITLLILVYSFKVHHECGLEFKVKWKTLPLYWPIALVLGLMLAGGVADELPLDFLFKMFILTLAVAIAEELMFRGLVFYWFKQLPKNKLILLSAVSFGMIHLVGIGSGIALEVIVSQVYFATGFGIIFAVARSRDYSIILAILVHWMFDFISLSSRGGVKETFTSIDTTQIVFAMVFAGSISWAWGLFLLLKKNKSGAKITGVAT
jgi:membrane protease YdiL (CAAX protease family)